jgi:hypothetical protein
MLLNKVLFVSLLVLGLFYLQPAQCDSQRLNTRIAGGFKALPNQFPYVVLITYQFTSSGVSVNYQGTGTIYSTNLVITSGNAVSKFIAQCGITPTASLFVTQGITDINNPVPGVPLTYTIPCTGVTVNPGFVNGVYFGDAASITIPAPGFATGVLRLPTSSPTAADINQLWVIGYGENFPGAAPSPQLTYAPINPMRNNLCQKILVNKTSLAGKFSFTENFCLQGQQVDPRTGGTTDACVLDAGAPVVRTSNITNSGPDYEVIGWVNFGTCTAAVPVISTYLFKYTTFFGAQTGAPTTQTPVNPRAFDGNFACGDSVVTPGLEKCDPSAAVRADAALTLNSCCDIWTCQYKGGGIPCSTVNNGTKCKTQPICDGAGKCRSKDKPQDGKCGGRSTRCRNGKCCNTITNVCV